MPPNEGWVHGVCALMWMVHARAAEEAAAAETAEAAEADGLALDLSGMTGTGSSEMPQLRSYHLGVLSRSLAPSVISLDLSQVALPVTDRSRPA